MIDSNQIGRDQRGRLPCASRWKSAAVAALGLTLTPFLLFFLGSTPAAAFAGRPPRPDRAWGAGRRLP